MTKLWTLSCLAGLLAWTLSPMPVRAEKLLDKIMPNVKIDAGVNAWFKIHTPNKAHMKNLAPWYTYFPYDPNMMSPQTGTIYPHWPQPFPPVPTQGQQQMTPPGGSSRNPPAMPPRPIAANFPTNVQPVGYSSGHLPLYWHAR